MPRGWLLVTLAVVLMLGLFGALIAGKPESAVTRHRLVVSGLQPIGVAESTWQTVIVLSQRDVDLPRAQVWAAWERLENWQQWAKPMVVDANWIDIPGWRAGARFEQTRDLGFPLRRYHTVETVGAATPGSLVSWWKESGGVRSNHIWSFEDLAGGGTRITNLEIFHGLLIGLARPMIQDRWQGRFDAATDGLILAARNRRP